MTVKGSTLAGILLTRMLCIAAHSEGGILALYLLSVVVAISLIHQFMPQQQPCETPHKRNKSGWRQRHKPVKHKPTQWWQLYHRSYFHKYRRTGRLAHPTPPTVEQEHSWVTTWKFWKPGWQLCQKNHQKAWPPNPGYWQVNQAYAQSTNKSVHDDRMTNEAGYGTTYATSTNLKSYATNQQVSRLWQATRQRMMCMEFNMAITEGLYTVVNKVVSWYANHASTQDNTYQILWDTGASKTLTFDQKDFIEGIEWFSKPQMAVGIASGLKILGKGKIRWQLRINQLETMALELEAYYCPAASRRLLCPQQLVNQLERVVRTKSKWKSKTPILPFVMEIGSCT
jgi:hypothetical protein